jgi:hypothetical protein
MVAAARICGGLSRALWALRVCVCVCVGGGGGSFLSSLPCSDALLGKLLYAMAPFIISERELAAVTDAMAAVVDAVEREAL